MSVRLVGAAVAAVAFFALIVGSSSASPGFLNAAYQAAAPGDTVIVPAGNYGPQVIDWRASMANRDCDPTGKWGAVKTANCITFDLQPGVVMGTIEIGGSGIYLKGTCGGSPIAGPNRTYSAKVNGEVTTITDDWRFSPDHVTVECIDANVVNIYDSTNVLFTKLDSGATYIVGGCGFVDENGVPISVGESKIGSRRGTIPHNVAMDSIYFHDHNRYQGGEDFNCHGGALFIIEGDGVEISNNVFSQAWVYDIIAQVFNDLPAGSPLCPGPNDCQPPPPKNFSVHDNWFGCGVETYSNPVGPAVTPNNVNVCNGQMAIQLDTNVENWTVVGNTNGPGTSLIGCVRGAGNCGNLSTVNVTGNVGSHPTCEATAVYSYNAWSNGPCGPTDVSWAGSLVRTTVGAEDFHLAVAGSAASLVPASAFGNPGPDIDGDARPLQWTAGSDQPGGSPPLPSPAQCANGDDDDADGKIDLADPGCSSATDDSESPDPPPPALCGPPVIVAGTQTDQTSTLAWAAVPDVTGYRFYKNGTLVSTGGAAARSVKFGKLGYGETALGVAAVCSDGEKLSTVRSIEARTTK